LAIAAIGIKSLITHYSMHHPIFSISVLSSFHMPFHHYAPPIILVFTALHGMQTRSSDENSVCPSITRVNCEKTVVTSVQIYIPHKRTFSLDF